MDSPRVRHRLLRETLRLKIALLVLLVVSAFGFVVVQQSVDALRAARVDASEREMLGIARTFSGSFSVPQLRDVAGLHAELRELRRENRGLVRTSIYVVAAGHPIRLAMSTTLKAYDPPGEDDVAPLATHVGAYHETVEAGRRYAELNYPLGPRVRPVATLGLYFDLTSINASFAARAERLYVLVALAALISAALVVVSLKQLLFSPMRRLQAAAREIERGATRTRLGWRRRDELGQLAVGFDRMAQAVHERDERLESLAMRDSLTGLSNHRHFYETLDVEMHRASTSERPLSLILLDVDHFKTINDHHGHPVGDDVLRAVGAAVRGLIRATDTAARIGGDEFAVLLPDATCAAAEHVAEKIGLALGATVVAGVVEARCSAGVATFPTHAGDVTSLVECADGALYWAKDSGGYQVRMYDPHHVTTTASAQRRAEIVGVLEDPEGIVPVFQPIVDLNNGQVAGYEALARFPKHVGERTPDAWVAEAHRCGLGPDLEAQAIRAALATGHSHAGFLSVNLSPSVAANNQVLENLPEDLDGIVVELTEHESLAGSQVELAHALDKLRARGARIAVDDAGAGYAGLQQIMRLRPDIIKLDRALVAGVKDDPARAALIECFVTFARRTNAEVCAEGIEDPEDLRALTDLGVRYGQGFALARPAAPWARVELPAETVELPAEKALAQAGATPS